MRFLLIEGDEPTTTYVERGLRQAGHDVDRTSDGREGLILATTRSYDAVVIDRTLPGLNVLRAIKTLRNRAVRTPVLLLSPFSGIDDRVKGLEAGADDYLKRPFAFSELMARLKALARRPPMASEATVLQVGDLVMDLTGCKVWRGDQPIDLRPREFKLLEVLMRNTGRLMTRAMLLERMGEFRSDRGSSIIESRVSRLRAKVDRPFDVPLIRTGRGIGYTLDARPLGDRARRR
jgi:two-component system OmpR family response regulator